ncbi:MAG: DUF5616 domain-containing protein [Oscillospiraceae bacterium]|nr:DUF5616 domain-containing protein [Oscillospiraceae bacterium]
MLRKSGRLASQYAVSNSGRLLSLIAAVHGQRHSPLELDFQVIKAVDARLGALSHVITSDAMILDTCISWHNLTAQVLRQTGGKAVALTGASGGPGIPAKN